MVKNSTRRWSFSVIAAALWAKRGSTPGVDLESHVVATLLFRNHSVSKSSSTEEIRVSPDPSSSSNPRLNTKIVKTPPKGGVFNHCCRTWISVSSHQYFFSFHSRNIVRLLPGLVRRARSANAKLTRHHSVFRIQAKAKKLAFCPSVLTSLRAAGLGFEPRLLVPETSVLPLDDPAIFKPEALLQYQFYVWISTHLLLYNNLSPVI